MVGARTVKTPTPLEREVQRTVVNYLKALRIYVAAVPNGSVLAGDAKARAMQSNSLKRTGMTPGFPDLILIKPSSIVAQVAFMEIKREGEKLRPEQEAFRDLCEDWRLGFAVVRSVEDARETLIEWGWL